MKLSYNWLKDYLKCDLSAQQIADAMTSIGIEVDGVEQEEQIRKINHSLEQAAVTDYLTGMNNREGFFAKVREWIKGSDVKDMTFLYIDLDNFKFYNDTFGHDIGDLILKQVAELIIHNAKNEA